MLIKSDRKALQGPVLSPDGTTLAVIAPDDKIHPINLSEDAQGRRFINATKNSRHVCSSIRECTILSWSPEVVFSPEDDASDTSLKYDFGRS